MNEFNKTEQSFIDYYKPLVIFNIDREKFSSDEWEKRRIDLIVDFYPGRENLTDEELLMEKYFSKDDFFYNVSVKRFIEWSGIRFFCWEDRYTDRGLGVRMGEGF